jgi:hypothetical protein
MFTCVSCFYPVANKHGLKYLEWFKNTLKVNNPYVFFTSAEHVDLIMSFRGDLPTSFILLDMDEFTTYPLKSLFKIHPTHCPSSELNLIWNEKIFMMERAARQNPFNTEWFLWIDAGICCFREVKPSMEPALLKLPKPAAELKNKIIYSASEAYRPEYVHVNNYYHHISGNYMIHRDFILPFSRLYEQYLRKLIAYENIWTEQVVMTHIYKDFPDIFYEWFPGYGAIAYHLFANVNS